VTTHIMRNGDELLCGANLDRERDYVHTLAFAARFGRVDCALCLQLQVSLSKARAERETTPTSAECERESERVCRATLSSILRKESA
jgi:hypothetical protein